MTYWQLEQIQKEHNEKVKVCIFGTGLIGRTWGYDVLVSAGFKIDFYYDNKRKAGEEIIAGIKTVDFTTLCREKKDVLVFVAATEKFHEEIKEQLEQNAINNYYLIGDKFYYEFCKSVADSQDKTIIERYKSVVDDASFLKRRFYFKLGYELNLEQPQTFNEKLQWLKINDRKPEYTKLVDKYEFKKHIENVLGVEYTIPTFGVWDRVEDIEWDKLPQQFVLKCTHDSGSVIVCRNKEEFDREAACKKLQNALERNFYWVVREWPYKDVKPRIIAEEYLQDGDCENLVVYKVLNFAGKPEVIQVIQNDKTPDETVDYFDTEWNLLNIRQNFKNSPVPLSCPAQLDIMLEFARKLSQNMSVIRTDFYIVNGKIYVSEFTFYSDAGMEAFHPQEWDLKLGELIQLA